MKFLQAQILEALAAEPLDSMPNLTSFPLNRYRAALAAELPKFRRATRWRACSGAAQAYIKALAELQNASPRALLAWLLDRAPDFVAASPSVRSSEVDAPNWIGGMAFDGGCRPVRISLISLPDIHPNGLLTMRIRLPLQTFRTAAHCEVALIATSDLSTISEPQEIVAGTEAKLRFQLPPALVPSWAAQLNSGETPFFLGFAKAA